MPTGEQSPEVGAQQAESQTAEPSQPGLEVCEPSSIRQTVQVLGKTPPQAKGH